MRGAVGIELEGTHERCHMVHAGSINLMLLLGAHQYICHDIATVDELRPGVEFYHFPPFSPELGAALLARRLDYARMLDPVTRARVQATPGMSGTDFYQSIIHGVWVNTTKKPFEDLRVRRAMHLVLQRPVLIEAVKDVATHLLGGFIYPFSAFATSPVPLTERPGYQADPTAAIAEARQLLAAAGHAHGVQGVDFLIRESHPNRLWAVAIQAMLHDTPHIETTLRTVQISSWFDEAQAGHFDLTISAVVSTLMDPSDYFSVWYGKEGPQNYSKWSNGALQRLLPAIAQELDEGKRQALVTQAEAILEHDPPLLPIAWDRCCRVSYGFFRQMALMDGR